MRERTYVPCSRFHALSSTTNLWYTPKIVMDPQESLSLPITTKSAHNMYDIYITHPIVEESQGIYHHVRKTIYTLLHKP